MTDFEDRPTFSALAGLPVIQRGEEAWHRNPASYWGLQKLIIDGLLPAFHCSMCPEGLQSTLHDRDQGFKQNSVYWWTSRTRDFHIMEKCLDKN